MGPRRTAFAAAMISLAMLSGCSAASHPTALAPAASSPVAVAPSVGPSTPPNSVAASPQASVAPSTQSASTARTPTSAAASPPAALSSNDVAANVRATAQAFIDDFNVAFATGDVTAIKALTSPTCGCRSLVKTIEGIYAKKQHFEGVVATLTSLQVVSFIATGATADVHYTFSAGLILDVNDNQVNTTLRDADQHSAMFVMLADGRWTVEQNTLLNAPAA